MSVPDYPLTWEQGDDAELSIIYKEGDPPAPVSLATASARMDISDRTGRLIMSLNSVDLTSADLDAAGNLLDQPGVADNEITLGTDGSIYILVPRIVTVNGALSTHLEEALSYDLFLRKNNKQRKILKGVITISRSNTRWL